MSVLLRFSVNNARDASLQYCNEFCNAKLRSVRSTFIRMRFRPTLYIFGSTSNNYISLHLRCATSVGEPMCAKKDTLAERCFSLLQAGPDRLNELRRLILLEGLPCNANELGGPILGRCSLRGLVWKALLGLGRVDENEYPNLVAQGPSADDSKVREDARRTFSKNDDFVARVPNDKMIRLLNAYVRACGNSRGVYAQSMSLLAAPFLYVMPEPDAFHCFRVLLQQKVPLYVQRYIGARRGCALLDQCLEAIDPQLHALFTKHGLMSEVYAFPSISSLGACVPPMSDTVRLWDIQLAFGVHMHIIFTLTRLLLASKSILATASKTSAAPLSTRELEQGLGMDAKTILDRAIPLSAELDDKLYNELVQHASIPTEITSQSNT